MVSRGFELGADPVRRELAGRPEIVSVRAPLFAGLADEPGFAQPSHRLAGVPGAVHVHHQVEHPAAGVRLMVAPGAGVLAVHMHGEASMSAVAELAGRAQPRVRFTEQGAGDIGHERRPVDRSIHDPLRSSFANARDALRCPE